MIYPRILRSPEEPGPSGGGGGGGGGDDEAAAAEKKLQEELDRRVTERVEKELSGIRNKNSELITTNKELKKQHEEVIGRLEGLGGDEGIQRLQTMHENLMKDELGKLLAEGKHEEWFEAKVQAKDADHLSQVTKLTEELETARSEREVAVTAYKDQVRTVAIGAACIKCKVVESAHDDVQRAAAEVFDNDPEHGLVIRDKNNAVIFGKDGQTPKTPEEWLDEQVNERRHWFQPSGGVGAQSGLVRAGASNEVDLSAPGSVSEWREKRKKLGMGTGFGAHNP